MARWRLVVVCQPCGEEPSHVVRADASLVAARRPAPDHPELRPPMLTIASRGGGDRKRFAKFAATFLIVPTLLKWEYRLASTMLREYGAACSARECPCARADLSGKLENNSQRSSGSSRASQHSDNATLATKRTLPHTRAGLLPAGSHQLAWRAHSITLSAIARIDCGGESPSAFAVRRLKINSNLDGI